MLLKNKLQIFITPLMVMNLCVQPLWAETITEATAKTVQSNPAILAEVNRSLSVDKTIRQAEGGYYPKADLDLGIGKEWSENASTRPGHKTLTRGEAGITASQMLYDGFATKNAVDKTQSQAESARFGVTNTAETTALSAIKAYLGVLQRQRLLQLTQDNLASHERIMALIQLRADSGVGNKADLEQTTGRLALANANVISNQGNLEDARSTYLTVVGNMPEDINEPGEDCCKDAPNSLEDALNIAYSQHPALRAAIADHEAALAEQQGAQAPFHPKVDLEMRTRADNDLNGRNGHANGTQAMVRMKYNLLNGGADQAREEETGYLSEKARVAAQQAKRQIENDVRLAWNALKKATDRLPILKQRVELAKKTREAYQQQFNIGQRSLLDLLDTENEVLTASLEYTNVYYERLYNCYWLSQTMGQLLRSMDIDAPEQGLVVASPQP